MSNQKQSASGDAQAYQANRDIVIHQGLTTENMSEIMIGLAKQLSSFLDEAKDTQEARFRELRDSILEEFSRDQSPANREAFKDPDFQYAVKAAHDSYARIGSPDARDELVKLIVERSTRPAGARVSRVLGSAIEIAAQISSDEYACLASVFYMQNTVFKIPVEQAIMQGISKTLEPFTADMSNGQMAVDYLASQGCLNISSISSDKFSAILDQKYSHAFSVGISNEELEEACGSGFNFGSIGSLLFRVVEKENRYFFSLGIDAELRSSLTSLGIQGDTRDKLVNLMSQRKAEAGQVFRRLEQVWPNANKVQDYWDNQGIQRASLTLLGKALAHSALKGRAAFDAPLEVWVN